MARVLAAFVAAAICVPAVLVSTSPKADAVFATGGLGRFRGLIDWFEWGTSAADIQPGPVTNTRQVGTNEFLTTQCTLSDFGKHAAGGTDQIKVYAPGGWRNDGLDDLYNDGKTGTNNKMYVGIANSTSGATVSFRVSCSMSLRSPDNPGGVNVPVPLPVPGLVVSDSESSNDKQGEYVKAKPLESGVTWRIIDRYRIAGCAEYTVADLAADNTLTLKPPAGGKECEQGGPAAVAFMEGATGADIEIKGGGTSAIAIGVVSFIDWGDAQNTYPTAGAQAFPQWSGGIVGPGPTEQNVFDPAFSLADLVQPPLRLGAVVDGEGTQPYTATATGDDVNAQPNDEDLAIPKALSAYRGGTVVLRDLACQDSGRDANVWGWIDFNGNRVFEESELSGPAPPAGQAVTPSKVPCPDSGRFTLAWNVPITTAPQAQVIGRFLITDDPRVDKKPVGVVMDGEVEDHAIALTLDPYTITKRSTAAGTPRPDDQITYTLEIAGPASAGPAVPPATITVQDNLAGVLDDATWLGVTSDSANPHGVFTFTPSTKLLTWVGPAPPSGQSVILQYTVRYTEAGNRSLDNVAWVDNPNVSTTPTCAIDAPSGTDRVTGEPCAVNDFSAPHLVLSKSSNHQAADRSNSLITYTVTAKNEGPGSFTTANPAVIRDYLGDILDDATYQRDLSVAGAAGGTLLGANEAAPQLIGWSGPLAAGQTATLTYSVRLNSSGNGTLENVAWAPNDPADPDPPTCASSPDPQTGEICAALSFGRPLARITKRMVDPPSDLVSGAVLKFEVTAQNTGQEPFTADRRLFVADDLADLWDGTNYVAGSAQAKVNGQTVADPTIDPANARLYWSGPLAVGETVVITYEFQLTGTGNGVIGNTAWAPRGQTPPTGSDPPPVPPAQCDSSTGLDAVTGEPCAVVLESRPLLRLSKTAQTDPLNGPAPGTRVRYTITGVNVGAAPYAVPVPIWDDLSDVLTDATLDPLSLTASVGAAPVFDSGDQTIRWSGTLGTAPGENTVVITYEVTLKPTGDGSLRNVAWVPRHDPPAVPACAGGVTDPDDLVTSEVCAAVQLDRPLLEVAKTADNDPRGARIGDTVHYTVTAKNVGGADFTTSVPAAVYDDLSGTLDDAVEPVGLAAALSGPAGSPRPPEFERAAARIAWSGALRVGQTVTITYSVTLTAKGDLTVKDVAWVPTNGVTPQPPACAGPGGLIASGADPSTGEPCGAVSFPLPKVAITKVVSPATGAARVGDHATFTITLENVGQVDYSAERPLVVRDFLADTLSDSTLDPFSPPTLKPGDTGSVGFPAAPNPPLVTYTGALAKGDTATITYAVQLTAAGDGRIVNVAWAPTDPASTAPPACASAPDGRDQSTGEACARVVLDFPVLRVSKAYNVTRDSQALDTLSYTVRVTNISPVPYQGAVIWDDLSDVLASATWVDGGLSATVGTAVFDEPQERITWTGDLAAAGQPDSSAVIIYELTVGGSAAPVVVNVAWQPDDPSDPAAAAPACDPAVGGLDAVTQEACARAEAPQPAVELAKTHRFLDAADPSVELTEAVPGATVEYTITAKNISDVDYTAGAPLVLHDDLTAILAGAQLQAGSWTQAWDVDDPRNEGAFEFGNNRLIWRGTLLSGKSLARAAGQTVTLTFRATLSSGGAGTIANVVWEPFDPYEPLPPTPVCESNRLREVEEACGVDVIRRPALTVTKTSDPQPGAGTLQTDDVVTYTVVLENTGDEDFTTTNPARLRDSLVQMLPGVTYQGDATASCPGNSFPCGNPVLDAGVLTWEEPLAAGESVTITYSVALTGAAPASLVNVAWAPHGPADLDPPDCRGGTVPGTPQSCAQVTMPRALVHLEKTAQAPAVPRQGSEVTYVIRFTNIGDGDFTASNPAYLLDDLSDVLANGVWKTEPYVAQAPSTGAGTLNWDSQRLSWTGQLKAGQTVAIVYSVTLTAQGDGDLYNVAWSPVDPGDTTPPDPSACPVTPDLPDPTTAGRCAAAHVGKANLAVVKTLVNPPAAPHTGDLLTYRITATNTGGAAFTKASPALIRDDLTGILAGAAFQRPASATYNPAGADQAREPDYTQPVLTWDGPLEAGQSVVIEYSVRLVGTTQTASTVLANTAWAPANPFTPGVPATPGCVDGQGEPLSGGIDPASGEPCSKLQQHRALLTLSKQVDDSNPAPGDTLTYQLLVANISDVAYTETEPAVVWDDLSGILDEADWVTGSETAYQAGAPGVLAGEATYYPVTGLLRWAGPIPAGGQVVVEYKVKVNPAGDGAFRNVAWAPFDHDAVDPPPPTPPCVPSTDGQPVTSVTTGEICAGLNLRGPLPALSKSSFPMGTVTAGEEIAYTLTATNVGLGPYTDAEPMVVEDDLAPVLDDSSLVEGSLTASVDGQPVDGQHQPVFDSTTGRLRWSGALDPGASLVVKFAVKVHGGGDGDVRNVVWAPFDPADPAHPKAPDCDQGVGPFDPDTEEACAADHRQIPQLTVTKKLTSQPPHPAGATLAYEVVITNVGPADFTVGHPAVVVDDFRQLLDGASYDGNAAVQPDVGELDYQDPYLTWSGPLERNGGTVTLRYSFTKAAHGDGFIRNVAWQPDTPHPSVPPETPDCDGPAGAIVDPDTMEPCSAIGEYYPSLKIEKTSDGQGRQLAPSDVVTYTIRATNIGQADYTDANPAVVIDDLATVLNGAVFNDDAEARVGGAIVTAPALATPTRLVWRSALAQGDTVVITFSVTLTGGANGITRNVAFTPQDLGDPDPEPPACDTQDPSDLLDPVTGEPCAADELVRPVLAVAKWSDAQSPNPGDTVEFTVSVSNTSFMDFDADHPAVFVDDMRDVLDDADFGGLADVQVTADPPGELTWNSPLLRWEGPLASGQSVVLKVKVLLKDTGDGSVRNIVWRPNDPGRLDKPDCDQASGGVDPKTQQPCSVEAFDKSGLQVTKTATPSDPMPGQTVTYRVTLHNTGAFDFNEGSPAWLLDDLSGVLEFGAFVASSVAVSPNVGQIDLSPLDTAGMLLWYGPLGQDESVVITYQVRLGDTMSATRTANVAWTPRDPFDPVTPACDLPDGMGAGSDPVTGEACAKVQLTPPVLDIAKTSVVERPGEATPPPYARPGDQVKYTLTITNRGSGAYTAAHPAVVVDTLTDVLDDATWDDQAVIVSGGGQLDWVESADRLSWTGQLDPLETVVVTYSVTLKPGGDGRLSNVVWVPDDPLDPGPPPSCEQHSGPWCASDEFPMPELSIKKTVRQDPPDGNWQAGVRLVYTLTLENTGPGDFTQAVPAVVRDDLSGVLDDSVWVGVVSGPGAGSTVWADPVLTWSGPLASGESAVLEYAVKLTGGGDGDLRNLAWFPNNPAVPPPPPDCEAPVDGLDPATGEPCSLIDQSRPILEIVSKSVDGGAYARPGDWLTYTVVAANVGPAAFTAARPAVIEDSLAAVLDDSRPFDLATASDGGAGGQFAYAEPLLEWRGPLAAGAEVVLTYRVQLGEGGDHRIDNVTWVPANPSEPLAPACVEQSTTQSGAGFTRAGTGRVDQTTGESCAVCDLRQPVLAIAKTSRLVRDGQSDEPAHARPGDRIEYTFRVENTGQGDYTPDHPAVVVDSLAGALDDALPFDLATASDNGAGGQLGYEEPLLKWSGPLAVGQHVDVTYSLTLRHGGDGDVKNAVWAPADPDDPGEPPACDNPGQDWCANDQVKMPWLSIAKTVAESSDGAGWPAGARLVYTLTLANTGAGDFTAEDPAVVRDDLSDVLDDAVWAGWENQPAAGSATWESPVVAWSGPLPAGEQVELAYAVELTLNGDGRLRNLAWSPNDPSLMSPPEPGCTAPAGEPDPATGEPCSAVDQERPILQVTAKRVDGEVDGVVDVRPGEPLTYRVEVRNAGPAAFTAANPAVVADSLADLLDDSEPFDLASASDGGAGGTFTYEQSVLEWRGPLAPGATATLTYSVTLKEGGDRQLKNVAWVPRDPAVPNPPPPGCDDPENTGVDPITGEACASSDVTTPVIEVAKSVAAPSPVGIGSVLRYSIVATNTSPVDFTAERPAELVDDLSDVLDDAVYQGDARASLGAVVYAAQRLRWSGPLGAGQSVTITYSVKVAGSGDGLARNTAWAPESTSSTATQIPPAECVKSCSSVTVEVPGRLPFTGANGLLTLAALAGLALIAGVVLLIIRRKTKTKNGDGTVSS
ncbi:MAG: CshA/CshB family fibrillar adhesin-related protein [Bifidobacteriaceae bacterium]|nr:CshA/CshB family fibrillar adhesin-related protein [Bifidobacteriaceae bacterium]